MTDEISPACRRLAEELKAHHTTTIAAATRVLPSTVSRWRRGITLPDVASLEALAQAAIVSREVCREIARLALDERRGRRARGAL
jgi:transcriptional regulator with XRE-family HTH domain